ncbi:MAG: hypothetical protein QOG93_1864, partial [Gaiellaceae bacterium]|nr:hypothetical protein [Gaiellaceae bacterium]
MPLNTRLSPLDAPPVAGLSLVFQPASVFASTSSTLTLVVSVPLNSPAVTMKSTDTITVIFPSADAIPAPSAALVKTLSGITTTPAPTWAIRGPRGGKFTIAPLNTTTLKPGDSLQFFFRNLSIVPTVGTPSVTLDVTSSAGTQSTPWPINVQAYVPGVIAWADPPSVALNASSTLRWTSNGGSSVRVSGFTTGTSPYKDFPIGVAPNTPVNPTLDNGSAGGSQHPYVVTLFANGQQVGSPVIVHVYLHTPYIAEFVLVQPDKTVAKEVTVKYGESVTPRWSCVFVDPRQGIQISYGSTLTDYPPVSQDTFDPSGALTGNDSDVVLTLTAPGWNATATDTVTV